MNRSARAAVAQETLAILKNGGYPLSDGGSVSIADAVARCVDATQLLRPHDLARIRDSVLSQPAGARPAAIEVVNETTLMGIARLLRDGSAPVVALNFASAKNPG